MQWTLALAVTGDHVWPPCLPPIVPVDVTFAVNAPVALSFSVHIMRQNGLFIVNVQ